MGPLERTLLTLLGGWMRFLLAWAGDKNRLFFEPVNSLKLGVWSGRLKGFVTSDRKFCLENLKKDRDRDVLNLDRPSSHYPRIHLRNLELATCTDRNVIEVLHTPLYGHRVAHLHHGSAFFGFQEFYLNEEEVTESFP